jgi:HTH-type transcriptional regulator/antitoxin HigA
MITNIITKDMYESTMQTIDILMHKGEANLTPLELDELGRLAAMAEAWENENNLLMPHTLQGMIAIKMCEKQINQKELAFMLDISATQLSEIMHSKRHINIEIAKKLHEILGISGDFILGHC